MQCKQPMPIAAACGPREIYDRSYTIPARWPSPPIHLVMENVSGACDYYRHSEPCCRIAGLHPRGEFPEGMIERPVREVIISFLSGCAMRPGGCHAVDFGVRPLSLDIEPSLALLRPSFFDYSAAVRLLYGDFCCFLPLRSRHNAKTERLTPAFARRSQANNGWMSMIMLSLGANVTSVEPASDFAEAVHLSGRLNCWGHRHAVINAYACEKHEFGPRGCMRSRRPWNGYVRAESTAASTQTHGHTHYTHTHTSRTHPT